MGSFAKATSLLEQFGVQLLRVGWCDNASVIRAKTVYCRGKNLENVLKDGIPLVKAAQVRIH